MNKFILKMKVLEILAIVSILALGIAAFIAAREINSIGWWDLCLYF